MTNGVLLAVFAHPDDESLLAGGLLSAAAAADMHVIVASASRGEAGTRDGSDTGALREIELKRAASILGVQTAFCLGFADGGLSEDVPALAHSVAELCASSRPDVVITFASDGWYWHPDHIAVADAVDLVVRMIPHHLSVYAMTWPLHRMTRLVRAARDRGAATGLWGLPTASFGSNPDQIDAVLDVRTFTQQKIAAITAHASQMGKDSLFASLPGDLAERYLGKEFIRVVHSGPFRFLPQLQAAGVGVRERPRANASPSVLERAR